MIDTVPITRALLSVSDKTGLIPFARALREKNVELLSTGGTFRALQEAGIEVIEVSAHTGFPEIMDGRVKTLHPRVHGGILGRRDDHAQAMRDHDIPPIDLVVVNLYPFEATVAAGKPFEDCVENIDIGGPAMIRSAAKNHDFVTVVTDAADYETVMAELVLHQGSTTLATRRRLAGKAYARTAAYDSAISAWFAKQQGETLPERFAMAGTLQQRMRYGENPHQEAALYRDGSTRPGVATARQLQGKELSYNNLADADAALELVAEFERPAVAIIKHANPCGVAEGISIGAAYARALACDPVSAFGGSSLPSMVLECKHVWEHISGYLDATLPPDVLEQVQKHLEHCEICSAILDSTRNILILTADERVFELPLGFSERLHARLEEEIRGLAP